MRQFFRYLQSSSPLLGFLFLFVVSPIFSDDAVHGFSGWSEFMRLVDAQKGSRVSGMAELKAYFRRFGYLENKGYKFDELFDDELQTALRSYQRNLGLSETGRLDYRTMSSIVSPRCGVADSGRTGGGTRRFAFFNGEPRWVRTPLTLTYAFSPTNTITSVNPTAVKAAFARAFTRWSEVIPMNFTFSNNYSTADIKIGWYNGDHGDGEPFDGVLGILAHGFSPETGRLHLDAAETWTADFSSEKSKVAVDLESVATHEIGHVLGLGHSSVKEAIMYPTLSPRTKKVELRMDDVEGIQALYGSNPNFQPRSPIHSDISAGQRLGLNSNHGVMGIMVWLLVIIFFYYEKLE